MEIPPCPESEWSLILEKTLNKAARQPATPGLFPADSAQMASLRQIAFQSSRPAKHSLKLQRKVYQDRLASGRLHGFAAFRHHFPAGM